MTPGDGVTQNAQRYNFPALPIDVPNGKIRAVLLDLDPNASVTFSATVSK